MSAYVHRGLTSNQRVNTVQYRHCLKVPIPHYPGVPNYPINGEQLTKKVKFAFLAQLTCCNVLDFGFTCSKMQVHYCLNADGVVAISNKACDVVHVFSSDIRTTLSVVVHVHPGHTVADPVHVALYWSVGPAESNVGSSITTVKFDVCNSG